MNNYSGRRSFVLISAVHVANNILKKGAEEDISITPLKLQKLVYFVFKDYLQRTGCELFSEQFETWTHGPVVPSIYTEFSSYGDNPIRSFAKDSRGKTYIVSETGDFKDSLDTAWGKYKRYTGSELSRFTHQENMAWTKARDNRQRYLNIGDIMNEPEPQRS